MGAGASSVTNMLSEGLAGAFGKQTAAANRAENEAKMRVAKQKLIERQEAKLRAARY